MSKKVKSCFQICKGKTQKGDRCQNCASFGSRYCSKHEYQKEFEEKPQAKTSDEIPFVTKKKTQQTTKTKSRKREKGNKQKKEEEEEILAPVAPEELESTQEDPRFVKKREISLPPVEKKISLDEDETPPTEEEDEEEEDEEEEELTSTSEEIEDEAKEEEEEEEEEIFNPFVAPTSRQQISYEERKMKKSPKKNFFFDILGIQEEDFKKLSTDELKNLVYATWKRKPTDVQERDKIILQDKQKHIPKQAGFFLEFSMKKVRSRSRFVDEDIEEEQNEELKAERLWESTKKKGTFSYRNGSIIQNRVEITALQSDVQNQYALFQLISSSNTIGIPIDNKELLTPHYIHNKKNLQSFNAGISTAASLIYRRYFLWYNKEDDPKFWAQNPNHQINLFDQVQYKTLPVTKEITDKKKRTSRVVILEESKKRTSLPLLNSGHVNLPQIINENLTTIKKDTVTENTIKVGFQRHAQVTSKLIFENNQLSNEKQNYYLNLNKKEDNNQVIHQLYTCVIDWTIYNEELQKKLQYHHLANKWSKILLDIAYEAPLRIAYIYGIKKVFLTLEPFTYYKNNLRWIVYSIEKMIDFIIHSGIEVILIGNKKLGSNKKNKEENYFIKRMKDFIKQTNGMYETSEEA